MPSRAKRTRKRMRTGKVIIVLIVLCVLVAIALIAFMIISNRRLSDNKLKSALREGYTAATQEPIVIDMSKLVTVTQMPDTQAATPTEIIEPDEIKAKPIGQIEMSEGSIEQNTPENRFFPSIQRGRYFLPICERAMRENDDARMIAITIDNCDDPKAMDQILELARQYAARLTLFPTGDALMDENMAQGFRACVRTLKFEVENGGYERRAEYRLTDGELAIQMWKQSIAASYALGGDYTQYFYRPNHKRACVDQRTHFYARRLGYKGIASYTHSYHNTSIEQLVASLENGNIYRFDMSELSVSLLATFIAEANRKGYEMVTLAELFDLPKNQISNKLTIDTQTLPEFSDYIKSYYDLKLYDRAIAVTTLQQRLIELNYLNALSPDGIYGEETSIAVGKFQASIGVPATGNADIATQQRLFAVN